MKRSVLGLAGLLMAACAVDPAVLGEGPPDAGPRGGGGGAKPPDETGGTATADTGGTNGNDKGGGDAPPEAGAPAMPQANPSDDDSGGTSGFGGSGSGGSGGKAGTTGSGSTDACEFEVSTVLSPRIPTVGIVEWSTALENVTSARIEFGLTDSYGMTAPATALGSGNRTLLLGMKQSRTYHYRISASSAVESCQSRDFTLETGVLRGDLQKVAVSTHDAGALAGGFLVTGQYAPTASMGSAPALIIDADGDVVW